MIVAVLDERQDAVLEALLEHGVAAVASPAGGLGPGARAMLAERGTIFWEIGADAGAHTRLAIQRSAEYRAAKIVQHLRAAPPAVIQASPPRRRSSSWRSSSS